jgi:hypothetical protein
VLAAADGGLHGTAVTGGPGDGGEAARRPRSGPGGSRRAAFLCIVVLAVNIRSYREASGAKGCRLPAPPGAWWTFHDLSARRKRARDVVREPEVDPFDQVN